MTSEGIEIWLIGGDEARTKATIRASLGEMAPGKLWCKNTAGHPLALEPREITNPAALDWLAEYLVESTSKKKVSTIAEICVELQAQPDFDASQWGDVKDESFSLTQV